MSISWVDASRFARHTKVIAVADVVESVRLMEQDAQEFIRRWHGFVGFAKQHLPLETGRMHKSLGDGLMMEFSEPDGCIRAALAMQAWFDEGNQGLAPEQQVHLRIGAHIAEFVADEHDIYGTDVNLTARIATLAGPGEIVISAALRERLGSQLAAQLEDLGACHLKHLRQPVHAFRVGRAGRAPVLPADSGGLLTRAAVGVLPFTSDAGSDGVGDAIADEAVAALTGVSQLQVISRLATAPLTLERAAREDLGRLLRAHYLLRGSARRSGNRLALFAELSEVGSGHVVWARSFKGKADDLLADGGALVHGLVAAVATGVLAREAERAQGQPFPLLESHTLLLAGVVIMHRLTVVDMELARAMLEHVVERSRRHPSAFAWLACWHVLQALQGWSEDLHEEQELAREHALAALAADALSPLALCMNGLAQLHMRHDLDAAARCYGQVLRSRPDDSLALLLQGELLALRGEGGPAQRCAERALQLCALGPMRYWYEQVAAAAALVAGDLPRALALAAGAVAAQPRFVPAHCTLAVAQAWSGQPVQSQQTLQALLRQRPDLSLARLAQERAAPTAIGRRIAETLTRAAAQA
jgi:class 3 adenylate cyclase/TolB-like protein